MSFEDTSVTRTAASPRDHSISLVFHRKPELTRETKVGFQTNSSNCPSDCRPSLDFIADQVAAGKLEAGKTYRMYVTVYAKADDVVINDDDPGLEAL